MLLKTLKGATPLLWIFLAIIVLSAPGVSLASQSERIKKFSSVIDIQKDGSLLVQEDITVVAAGQKIKHGIYRDFPTSYRDPFGNKYNVSFDILEVLRNGYKEPYFLKNIKNGKRLYIGRKNFFLEPGTHTYTIIYRTNRQIGYFKDYDELYWNVTGNGWDFVIDKAVAVVHLPAGAYEIKSSAYTGTRGAKGKDYTISHDLEGNIVFSTTRPLQPGEGLTIAVAWPKGYVQEPAPLDKVSFFLKDNLRGFPPLVAYLLFLGYLLYIWAKVGKDPEPGTIVPRFKPPEGLSPAAVRFISRMGFDQKAMTAALVDMAVKGAITIKEQDGNFVLTKNDDAEVKNLSPGEKKVLDILFQNTKQIVLGRERQSRFRRAMSALANSLESEYEGTYFRRNLNYMVPAGALAILCLLLIIFTAEDRAQATFMTVWLGAWSIGVIMLVKMVVNKWRYAFGASGTSSKVQAIFTSLFALPFVAAEILGFGFFMQSTSMLSIVVLLATIGTGLFFYNILKAPTALGRKVMDEIEGFKMYLTVAEKERLKAVPDPTQALKTFETYLPYAIALDVEQEWAKNMSRLLQVAEGGKKAAGYSPLWYQGRTYPIFSPTALASKMGSDLTSSVLTTAAPPSARTGSAGGGFSGGGSGGGGGGGW